MRLKYIFCFLFFCAFMKVLTAQDKKDVKKNKIKSVTEFVVLNENGKDVTFKGYYKAFDKNGKSIEETEFNRDGSIQKKDLTKYDKYNNKIEETNFKKQKTAEEKMANTKEKNNVRTTYKYNANNDKTEESTYDAVTGKLISKETSSYNNKGEKSIEEIRDGDDKLVKKIIYAYEKGLKSEKKIFNADNVLLETKKYIYEFY